ncbi:MAG TPA: isopentenyl phosphate kinase [Candidatus Acidoferrales bacterium]|nr:isopentenyl phosphate kinase [Candidatus Acidoferrales bacterium]
MAKDLILIKIGGSVITDVSRPNTAKNTEIRRLLKEIADAKKAMGFDIIIGHGSGSFAHIVGKRYRVNEGLVNEESRVGASLTHMAAQRLNMIVNEIGLDMGLPMYSFTASSFSRADSMKLDSGFSDSISTALATGFIPTVYGDVVLDSKQGVAIASTEEIFRFLSQSIKPTKIIMGTDVNGIYDKDPMLNAGAKLVKSVHSGNYEEITKFAGEARKIDVSGGMHTKLSRLYEMVNKTGATGFIANATVPGTINKILQGKESEIECTVVTK